MGEEQDGASTRFFTPPAGRRCYVAVLFSDLCGSTLLADTLDADTYAEMLEAIRVVGTETIRRHGGDLAQVYGDGLLSIFQRNDATERAIDAALELHAAVAGLTVPGIDARSLRMHSGIHTGLVLLRPGDRVRGVIEAVGRTTSLAARLSASAKQDEILVSVDSLGPGRARRTADGLRTVDIGAGLAQIAAVPIVAPSGTGAVHADPQGNKVAPFIGRSQVLAELMAACDGLADGIGFRFGVVAAPGLGKSRLAQTFADRARAKDVRVLIGTCSASAAVGPLLAFRQIADAILPTGRVSSEAPDVPQLLAAIAELLALQPLVLILDDWQWADSASIGFLSRLLDLPGPLGLLLLSREADSVQLQMRPDQWRALPAMSAVETAALVGSLRPDLDPIEARRVHELSGGNPLFVEELCLLDSQSARAASRAGNDSVVPGWLAALIGARAEVLPEPARALLDVTAVIGSAAPRWLLDDRVGTETVATYLPLLVAADLLSSPGNDGVVHFRHGITWQIVYSMIPLALRRRLHAEIAEILKQSVTTPGIDTEEALGWHFLASDQSHLSWPHAERAGDRAATVGSLDRAQLQYRIALDALAALPAGTIAHDRYRALVAKFGYACIFDAEPTQLAVFEAAVARAQAIEDREAEAEAEYWIGYVCQGFGQIKESIHHGSRALELSSTLTFSQFNVQARASLGQAHAVATNYAQAVPLLDGAIAIKRQHRSAQRPSAGLAYALAQRAAIHADTGSFAEADAMIAEALAVLNGEAAPVEASVMAWAAVIEAWKGDWVAMLGAATRGADVAQRIEAVYIHAISRAFGAYARWKLGGGDAAADALVEATQCMIDRGKCLSLSIAYGFLAEVEVSRRNVDAARRAVLGAYSRARAGDRMGLAWAARAWAGELASTRPQRARVFLARARASAAQRQSPHEMARCNLAATWLGLDASPERDILLRRAAHEFAQTGLTTTPFEVNAAVSEQ
jgi:tetratricopeptide (TPR) repeat protein